MIEIKAYNNDYCHLYDFIAKIPTVFEQSGEIIYEDRNTIRRIKAPDGSIINVKRYCKPKGINRFVYSMGIRKPKGERAFYYPELIEQMGIATPTPIAYIEERHCGIIAYSWFVSIHCPYEHTMKDIVNFQESSEEILARKFSRFTAGIHNKGVIHLDYSPGNILFRVTENEDYLFALVDTNRMRFGNRISIRDGIRNMRRLWGSKRFFIMVVEEYVRARDASPAKWIKYALEVRAKFWTKYGKRHTIPFEIEL